MQDLGQVGEVNITKDDTLFMKVCQTLQICVLFSISQSSLAEIGTALTNLGFNSHRESRLLKWNDAGDVGHTMRLWWKLRSAYEYGMIITARVLSTIVDMYYFTED